MWIQFFGYGIGFHGLLLKVHADFFQFTQRLVKWECHSSVFLISITFQFFNQQEMGR